MRSLATLVLVLVFGAGWSVGFTDRSGEPLLLNVIRDMRSGRSWHVRISRETQDSKGSAFLADRVTEVWLDGSGAFRVEQVDLWGDGFLCIQDRSRRVWDSLGPLDEAIVEASEGNWRLTGLLKGLLGEGSSPFFDLLTGKLEGESLVAKDGEIVELPIVGDVHTLRLKTPNRDALEIQVARKSGAWRVIGLLFGEDSEGGMTREWIQNLPAGPRARFDTAPWKQLAIVDDADGLDAPRYHRGHRGPVAQRVRACGS